MNNKETSTIEWLIKHKNINKWFHFFFRRRDRYIRHFVYHNHNDTY